MSAFRDAVFNDHHKKQRGENGCTEYTDAGIGSRILALSQLVRGGNPDTLATEVLASASPKEVKQLAVLVFATRNTRGGKGEKKLSYDIFRQFVSAYPATAAELLCLFPLYGYWKDIFLIMELEKDGHGNSVILTAAYSLIKEQWDKDLAAAAIYKQALDSAPDPERRAQLEKAGPKISLLSKWLPREGKSLDKKLGFVQRFARLVYGDDAQRASSSSEGGDDSSWKSAGKTRYRKQVVELTSYLALPEILLAARRADEINIHQRVASKATKLLTNAFLNERADGELRSKDPKRLRLRDIFIETIMQKGLKGGQVMPHEIVATILKGDVSRTKELALDAQWKDIWKNVVTQVKAKAAEEGVEFDPTRMVPLCDVSASMSGIPMEVSIALGIGISEITHPAFKDMVLTFDSTPVWHRLNPTDTIVKKVQHLENAPWGCSTDFIKAYDLILEVCLQNRLKREDMPCLIVFSDMQFDQAGGYYCYDTEAMMFQTIRRKVRKVAMELGWEDSEPTPIVFWNLRNTGGHPVDKDTEGTVMLSGFSPSLLKLVMSGEALKEEEVEVVQQDGTVVKEKLRVTTPEQLLQKMLDDSLYDPVREILGKSNEGALREYEWLPPITKQSIETSVREDDEFELI
jgi:hypothetical protein